MAETMQCQLCGGEMEPGILIHDGNRWTEAASFTGALESIHILGKEVVTYRCTNCGHLESFTK